MLEPKRLIFKNIDQPTMPDNPDNQVFNLPGDTPREAVKKVKEQAAKVVDKDRNNPIFQFKNLDEYLASDHQVAAEKVKQVTLQSMQVERVFDQATLGQKDGLAYKQYVDFMKNEGQQKVDQVYSENLKDINVLLSPYLNSADLISVENQLKQNANSRKENGKVGEAAFIYAQVLSHKLSSLASFANAPQGAENYRFSGDKKQNAQMINQLIQLNII